VAAEKWQIHLLNHWRACITKHSEVQW